MSTPIFILFGKPKHGWLPVDFRYNEFHLDFEASDALNDPIEELYYVITDLQDKEKRQIIWWLEPAAYFFDILKNGKRIILTVRLTDDLHDENANKTVLVTIMGNENEILDPLRSAFNLFSLEAYDENHWSSNFKQKTKTPF